ncbi:VC1380 family protein [Vibrio bathopelagicus]
MIDIDRYNVEYSRLNESIVKVSELQNIIDHLPNDSDPDIVMGEEWLPERLVNTKLDGELLFMEFDNAPEENQGDDEGRGFVEHEIAMIREKLEQLLDEPSDTKTKADALLAIFLMGHELSSSEVIEVLETTEAEMAESDTTVPETSACETNEPQTPELEASALETKQLNDSPPTI